MSIKLASKYTIFTFFLTNIRQGTVLCLIFKNKTENRPLSLDQELSLLLFFYCRTFSRESIGTVLIDS